jgi:hypothetical protein
MKTLISAMLLCCACAPENRGIEYPRAGARDGGAESQPTSTAAPESQPTARPGAESQPSERGPESQPSKAPESLPTRR